MFGKIVDIGRGLAVAQLGSKGLKVEALTGSVIIEADWQKTNDSVQYVQKFLNRLPTYDAIVVLGAGNAMEKGRVVPGPDGELRAIAGAEEFRRNPQTHILFSGGGKSGVPEAIPLEECAFNYFPIPEPFRHRETDSIDTVSEIHKTIDWVNGMKAKGFKMEKIGVVTNGYHMRTVQVLGHNLGIDLYPVVAEEILLETKKPDLIKKVEDFKKDAVLQDRIKKEQERIIMLYLDPESTVSHDRTDWLEKHPELAGIFTLTQEALAIAGRHFFPYGV